MNDDTETERLQAKLTAALSKLEKTRSELLTMRQVEDGDSITVVAADVIRISKELEKVRAERDHWKAEHDQHFNDDEETTQQWNKFRVERDAVLAQVAELTKERDDLRHEKEQATAPMFSRRELLADRNSLCARVKELEAQCAEKDEALQRQHNWHLAQSERTPVYFGDTIGQINADEYQDSQLCELTVAALSSTGSAFLDRMKRMKEALRIIKARTDEKIDLPPFDTVKINFLARAALNLEKENP